MGHYSWCHRNKKDHKRILWATVCQQIMLAYEETENLNRPITSAKIYVDHCKT